MAVQRFDHVGVVVDDLDAATAFFLDLGLEREGGGPVEGAWADRIVDLDGVHADLVVVRTQDGHARLELTKFRTPTDDAGPERAPVNRLGFRHVAFEVDDLDAMVDHVRRRGLELVGEVVNYQDVYRLCYVRGPEGLIVELAEPVGPEPGS